jgi:RNA polymerase sigma factor (sigma-70 family)
MDIDDLATVAKTDQRARARLFAWLHVELASIVRRRIAGPDVDDVIQDTLLAVSCKLGEYEYRGPGSFRKWVRGFVKNQTREQQRRAGRHRDRCRAIARGSAIRVPSTSITSRLDRQLRFDLVRQEAEQLPSQQRRVILATLEGKDAGQLAELEGISRDHARAILSRAQRTLRQRTEVSRSADVHPQPPSPTSGPGRATLQIAR